MKALGVTGADADVSAGAGGGLLFKGKASSVDWGVVSGVREGDELGMLSELGELGGLVMMVVLDVRIVVCRGGEGLYLAGSSEANWKRNWWRISILR
jgi:hypothetical protein